MTWMTDNLDRLVVVNIVIYFSDTLTLQKECVWIP